MSATTSAAAYRRATAAGWLSRLATGVPVPIRAFLLSRAIVIAAGAAGALAVPRRLGWTQFDPLHVSDRLGTVGDVLAAPSIRWDSIHYLAIAGHGYAAAGNTAFFPMYPLLIRAVGAVIGSAPVAGVAISAVSLIVALGLLHRLTELELGRRAADATVMLLALSPLSFFFTAVYTESLFLALSLGALYAGRRGRWAVAGPLAGLAAVTRVPGIVIVVPLALMYVKEHPRPGWRLGWLALAPAALACFLGYLAARGFGALAPLAQQTGAHQHQMGGPFETLVSAVRAAVAGIHSFGAAPVYEPTIRGPFTVGAESVLLLGVLALAVVALVAAFRRLPIAYGAYACAALLVSIWSPVAGQPLRSVDRYTLTIFPLWMVAGAWISQRRLTRATLLVSAGLLAFWTFQFATWSWVA